MQPAVFATDRKKGAVCYQPPEALAWASPYVEKDDVILDNFNSFVAALNQVCDDPNRCPTAEAKLHNLWQGRRSVAEYTTEFRHWISDTN